MKNQPKPKFKKDDFVCLVMEAYEGKEFRVTGSSWNGFTFMLDFEGEDIRCGQEYAKPAYFIKNVEGKLCVCTKNINPCDTYFRGDKNLSVADERYEFLEDDYKAMGYLRHQDSATDGQVYRENQVYQEGNLHGLPTTNGNPKPGTFFCVSRTASYPWEICNEKEKAE